MLPHTAWLNSRVLLRAGSLIRESEAADYLGQVQEQAGLNWGEGLALRKGYRAFSGEGHMFFLLIWNVCMGTCVKLSHLF